MSKHTKALLYNFLGFAIFFIPLHYIFGHYTAFRGIWVPLAAFAAGTILAPKFQAVRSNHEVRIFVRWLFFKGAKEVK